MGNKNIPTNTGRHLERKKKHSSSEKKDVNKIKIQAKLLSWILHEWDCSDIEDAKIKALNDQQLHTRLREAGVSF